MIYKKKSFNFSHLRWWNRATFLIHRFNNSTTNLTITRKKKKLVKRGGGKHVITRNLRSRNWTLLALKKRDWNSKQGCFRGKCRAKNGVNTYLKLNYYYYLPFLWFIKMHTVKHWHKFNVRFRMIIYTSLLAFWIITQSSRYWDCSNDSTNAKKHTLTHT